jgi:acetylornithine/succinyldiaminopimelate/putrescine aminotransferase
VRADRVLLRSLRSPSGSWSPSSRTAPFSPTTAIQFLRKFQQVAHPDKDDPLAEFLAFNNCFHSQTMGSVTLTCKSQYQEPVEPVIPCVTFVE